MGIEYDYQAQLRQHIADIPAIPGQINSGEAKPRPYSADFVKKTQENGFALPTNEVFKKHTGTTHTAMVKSWAAGNNLTSCNGLAGTCGRAMGAKHFLGQFELEAFLRGIGKGHAYVPASSGKRPGYGDIFRARSFHMGVSLGFEGDDWLTVEGGQGGSLVGYDVVKRKRQPWSASQPMGWCDMRLYLDPRPPIPDWLVGTWMVESGNERRQYRITQYYDAFRYPADAVGDLTTQQPLDTGEVALGAGDTVEVKWGDGRAEKLTYDRFNSFPGIIERATGAGANGEPIKAVRL